MPSLITFIYCYLGQPLLLNILLMVASELPMIWFFPEKTFLQVESGAYGIAITCSRNIFSKHHNNLLGWIVLVIPWQLTDFEIRHLLNALVGFAGVVGVYLLARSISGSSLVGLGAALFLILSPRYYGHTFNNPKDIPFAVFYLFSIFAIIRCIPYWDRKRLPSGKIIRGCPR